MTDIIVSDWGKLQAASANQAFQPVSRRTAEKLETLTTGALSGSIWGKLLPRVYQQAVLRSGPLNPSPTNPSTYRCSMQGAFGPRVYYHPFGSLNPVNAGQFVTPVANSSSVNLRTVLPIPTGSRLPTTKSFFSEFPQLPPASQMTTLFTPIAEGGLGQFQQQFFPRYFGTNYRTIACSPAPGAGRGRRTTRSRSSPAGSSHRPVRAPGRAAFHRDG